MSANWLAIHLVLKSTVTFFRWHFVPWHFVCDPSCIRVPASVPKFGSQLDLRPDC